jgi:hypothetical protein
MKRLSCAVFAFTFVLIVIGIQPLFAQVQGQWASTGTMLSARELNAQVLLSTGKVLSIGGVDGSGNLLASSELYSSTSGKWTLTGNMSNARRVFPAVVLPNKKVLVLGGLGAGGTVLAGAELYDPTTGAWSSAGSLSVARFAHTATLLGNGKVLVAGGCTVSNCTDTVVSELYDPTLNSWSTTGNLNTARSYHTAVRLKSGSVLAIGGSGSLVSCELYNPANGTWTTSASTNAGRYLNTTTLLPDGKVLVTGGANGRFPVSSAELYDPTANTWTYTGNMTTGRYSHTATLLADGTVLVAGGFGQSISCGKDCTGYIPTAKVDIYSETNGSFTAAAGLRQPQAYQSTTLLKTGGALQTGGIGTTSICCVVLNTAQIYTPLTLTFSASSLNFGLLQIGMTSPPQTVTVTNVSNHSVKFSSVATSGEFSQSDTCLPTLASGQNCTITVTFKPTVAGTKNSAVTLKDNSSGSPTQIISLTGTGETLALGFTPGSLNLGSVAVGSSITQSATLTNDGSAPVNLTGYSISPADGTFTQTNNCPATLNVQQTCTFQITFTPPDVFTYNATLSVTNSAGAAATLPLTGTGLDGG